MIPINLNTRHFSMLDSKMGDLWPNSYFWDTGIANAIMLLEQSIIRNN